MTRASRAGGWCRECMKGRWQLSGTHMLTPPQATRFSLAGGSLIAVLHQCCYRLLLSVLLQHVIVGNLGF